MIKINNICKKYGKSKILDHISFEINPGDCIGIIGSNGSGKTTLVSIISGISKPDAGEIECSKNCKIGYVPQENPLIDDLSAIDNLRIWYKKSRRELKKEIKEGSISKLGIDAYKNKSVSKLSGGMKKRLNIAIALLDNPELIIMDEPSAALDLTGKYQIREYMKYFTETEQKSIIVVSHDLTELSVCNRLYCLKDGKLIPVNPGYTDKDIMDMLA